MSEECGYDQDWWKTAKATSIERKHREVLAGAAVKPGDTFLIVTEGTVTEPLYFECILRDLQLRAVYVKVIPGNASDPRYVINTAAKEVKDLQSRRKKGLLAVTDPEKYDHVWAVIDTDVAVRRGFWNEVKQLAVARNVKLAHSTPCFEFWLLLHLQDTTRGDLYDGDAAKHAVRQELGRDYSTCEKVAREAMPLFMPYWPKAVRNAQRVRFHHYDAATQDPANPSTEVDLLIKDLNDSAPTHARQPIHSPQRHFPVPLHG